MFAFLNTRIYPIYLYACESVSRMYIHNAASAGSLFTKEKKSMISITSKVHIYKIACTCARK
jgi:hypothetical protein